MKNEVFLFVVFVCLFAYLIKYMLNLQICLSLY